MRFPWSKPKPKRNTDGGPTTALFSFDRDRERQMAEAYSGSRRQDWIAARYVLIDEVLEYRRTGQLSQSLLDACDAEISVAAWPYSSGVKRLVELTRDGHSGPVERLEDLMSSKDWRVRHQALQQVFLFSGTLAAQRQVLQRGLADRSGRIRSRMAAEAVFAHIIEATNDIEHAAVATRTDKEAKAMFQLAHQLRVNERAGVTRVIGGDHFDHADFEQAWERFRSRHRPTRDTH